MGNFLIVVPSRESPGESVQLFRAGLEIAQRLGFPAPSAVLETKWAHVASFPRANGSGAPVASDQRTGSWLTAIGTWFHAYGVRSGDMRSLLARYLEVGGEQLARELEGFFVLAVGDGRTQETILLTDIVGSCHCFQRDVKGGIVFSGSSLLLAALERAHLDSIGCQEFLSTGIIYENRTLYREVRKLGPAAVLGLTPGAQTIDLHYWRTASLAPGSLRGSEAVEALWHALVQAARKVGTNFERVVCDLTGGYDSRSLIAAFLGAGVKFSTVVSGAPNSPDVAISKLLAERLDLPHLHLSPEPECSFEQIRGMARITDGEYDLVEYVHIFRVHSKLSRLYDISINGSFGEVARGYWWELLFPRLGARHKLDALMLAQRRFAAQPYDASLFPQRTRLHIAQHLASVIERANEGLFFFPNTMQMDNAYLTMRMQRWQGRIASSTNRLWPCLSPFMFRSVLETMLQIESKLRRRSLLVRKMLARFQPQLAEAPLEHGYPAVPVSWKNFHRFWPLPEYYARKILTKIRRKLGQRPAMGAGLAPPRLQLWQEPAVQAIMRASSMRSGCLLEAAALERFLKYSQQPGFTFNDQWTRLLSLEYTFRILDSVGTSPVP